MNSDYESLLDSLLKDGYLKTPSLIDAFRQIDRADFVLDEYKAEAYVNAPLSIGHSQTISQPLTVAFMLELLQPKAGEKILEVGAGSGWQTAILGQVVGKGQTLITAEAEEKVSNVGKVLATEIISDLKEMAEKNISKYNFIEKGIVQVILSDGSKGCKTEAPFNKIIAGAAAEGDVPKAWKQQLKIGGRIVAPVGNSIVVIEKISKTKYNKKEYFGFRFVPLVEG